MNPQPYEETCRPMHPAKFLRDVPVPWMHTIPSYMPWSTQGTVGNAANVVKFTASSATLPSSSASFAHSPMTFVISDSNISQKLYFHHQQQHRLHPILHSKRKGSNLDDEIPIANKVYISEEKMVARMNDLHISNSTELQKPDVVPGVEVAGRKKSPIGLNQANTRMNEMNSSVEDYEGPVLVLSPELQKLQKTDPILPPVILEKLQKSCMELVVWKPPEPVLNSFNVGEKRQKMPKKNDNVPHLASASKGSSSDENCVWSTTEQKEMDDSMEII